MILRNPTDQKVSLIYLGNEYSIDPLGTFVGTDEVCEYWRTRVHLFLEVINPGEVSVKESPEEVKMSGADEEEPVVDKKSKGKTAK